MNLDESSESQSYWRSKSGLVVCAFLGLAGVILILEHRAHLFEWLPYLVLLACPLMHIFMHRGHGGHARHAAGGSATDLESPDRGGDLKR